MNREQSSSNKDNSSPTAHPQQQQQQQQHDLLLCRMGCGFFGSAASDGCCSKCWRLKDTSRSNNKKEIVDVASSAAATNPVPFPASVVSSSCSTESTNNVTVACNLQNENDQNYLREKEVTEVKLKMKENKKAVSIKKKKKLSYKSLLSGVVQGNNSNNKKGDDREALRKVTGGGIFLKVDKI